MANVIYLERNPGDSLNPVRREVNVSFKPLTRKAAEQMGHIAWIEDTDPVRAIRSMFNAVASGSYNSAVWANARIIEPTTQAIIRDWRYHEFECTLPETKYYARPCERLPESIDRISNLAPDEIRVQGQNLVGTMLAERQGQIRDALPAAANITGDLRPNGWENDTLDAHFDGGGDILRLIETFNGSTTILYDNKNVEIRHDKTGPYCHLKDDDITVWTTPPQGLTLLTAKGNSRPIAHGTPLKMATGNPEDRHRIVMTYNVVLP